MLQSILHRPSPQLVSKSGSRVGTCVGARVGTRVGARVGAHVCPILVGERVGARVIVQPSVKAPCSLLSYPFTTNHSLRGDDCVLVMVTVCVSGSSMHLLPPLADGYEAGLVLSLQNALCLLSKSLTVWPMEMELPGCSTTKNL